MARRTDSHKIRFPRKRTWQYSSAQGITVCTYGIPNEFHQAFQTILLETRRFYRRLFGRRTIGCVELSAEKAKGKPLRLWTNGTDRIFFTLNRKSQLEPAAKGGVRNLHGLTHELAHIVLYRSLVNIPALAEGWGEGWAVYVASFWGVPHLFEKFGEQAWPYPHDYTDTDGPARYERCFANDTWMPYNAIARVVRDLHRWEQHVGRDEFIAFFRALLRSPIRADHFNAQVLHALRRLPRKAA